MTIRTELPRLSTLFQDPALRAVFARAERDTPPAALAVETPKAPVLPSRGEAEKVCELELA